MVSYKSDPVYEFDVAYKYIYGYEHGLTFINLFMMVLITGFALAGKSIFNKILVILLPVIYFPMLGFYYFLVQAGWGAPFGNPLVSGVWVMIAADILIVIRCCMAVFRKNTQA